MKNVQIPLMIFILSLLLLSLSQSILQTVSPTNYSLHFKHTHTVMFNHLLTSQICPINVSLSATGGTASKSDNRLETSDAEFNNAKLAILYMMLQFKIMSIQVDIRMST